MRQIFFAASLLIISIPIMSNTNLFAPKPALFPAVQHFYDSAKALAPITSHGIALNDLAQCITTGIYSDKRIDLLFTCSDNSFRSLAAQIVLQSQLSLYKYNKLIVSSYGFQNAEVNSTFITILRRHGFLVTAGSDNKTYEVKFGENVSPIFIYAKQANDATIPKSALMQVKLCSSDETVCTDFTGAKVKESLPFSPPSNISEEEMDKEFSQIAGEILYAYNKAQ